MCDGSGRAAGSAQCWLRTLSSSAGPQAWSNGQIWHGCTRCLCCCPCCCQCRCCCCLLGAATPWLGHRPTAAAAARRWPVLCPGLPVILRHGCCWHNVGAILQAAIDAQHRGGRGWGWCVGQSAGWIAGQAGPKCQYGLDEPWKTATGPAGDAQNEHCPKEKGCLCQLTQKPLASENPGLCSGSCDWTVLRISSPAASTAAASQGVKQ